MNASYTLDAAGNRLAETVNGSATTFDLDLSAPNATVLGDGTRKYLPGAPGAGSDTAGVWSSALTDLVGSPLQYVSQTGTTTTPVHYGPYGVARTGSADPTGIGYAGEWKNATGLVNLRARGYDPVMARFIGRDTYGGALSAPQSGNRYSYAANNPFRYTDPSGHIVDFAYQHRYELVSLLLSVTPGVGLVYLGFMGVTGYDPITGQNLSPFERGLAAIPIFGAAARALSRLGEGVADASRLGRMGEAGSLERTGPSDIAGVTESTFIVGDSGTIYLPTGRTINPIAGASDDTIAVVRGGENAAAARGRAVHEQWKRDRLYGPNYQPEFLLPSGRRSDAVNFATRDVIELKPNNPRAIRRGERQAKSYAEELAADGQVWTWRVVTYD